MEFNFECSHLKHFARRMQKKIFSGDSRINFRRDFFLRFACKSRAADSKSAASAKLAD